MKFHKIRNVPLNVCTAEQKIAYNLASSYADCIKGKTWLCDTDISRWLLAIYMDSTQKDKYDLDGIFCALNAGTVNFVKHPFIATSYKQIGDAFPVDYAKGA